jgi:uncharacterized protein involved in outer membrane biogenesis
MARRRLWLWLPLGLGGALVTVVVIAAIVLLAFSDLVRVATVQRLQAMTGRPVAIEALKIDPWTGRIALRGLLISDVDGTPLATLERLDAQVRRRALLRGHISLKNLAIDGSTVRVVRYSQGDFNISELIPKKSGGGGSAFDVTVSDFALTRGTVLLEDRMLRPAQMWRSEDLTIHARNVSTRRDDGTGEATSTVNGSPVSVRVEQLRLKPVHLRAVVDAKNVDVAMARVYLPPDAPVTLERGRLDLTLTVVNDARQGLHLDADAAVVDAVAIRAAQRDPFIQAPALRVAVRAFTVSPQGAMAVGRVDLDGRGSVLHGDVTPPARFDLDRVRLSAEGLTWPVQAPARVSLVSTVPGGGELRADGTVRMKPAIADLDVRLSGLAIEPWARYVSSSAKATGFGEARLAVRANLEHGLAASATGTVAVNRVLVTDGGRRLLAAERAEVSGIDAGWPLRVALGRVTLRRPAVSLERDADGVIVLPTRDKKPTAAGGGADEARAPVTEPPPITIREVVVDDGTLDWRDTAVKPAARLEMRAINLAVHDVGWPLERPAAVQLRLRTPGGGALAVNGNATLETADVRIRAQGVDLVPYRSYLPITGSLRGSADADVRARVARASGLQVQVRGDAGLSRAFLADGARRIASIERARARGIDVDWPGRVAVDSVTLRQPWLLVERDEQGAFPLRALLSPANGPTNGANDPDGKRTIAVRRLVVEDGGVRFVDRSIAPPYSEDLKQTWLQVTGLASAPAQPARLEMRGVLGTAGRLSVRGQLGALGGPTFVDATAELRDMAIPRMNPYLQHYTAWTARQGRLTTTVTARVEGDALQARTQTQLGGLQVVRVASDDASEKRMGLPLGMVVALLKDRQGNIKLALPVGGSLNDPRFGLHDAIWGAVRTTAVKTIAAPVSWIGRLRVTRDSKIQDIEVDPVPFAVGGDELTREAAERVGRIAAFMKELPDVRMILTPAVSLGDVEALKAEQIRARIKELTLQQKLSERDAAARLYAEQYPKHEPPDDVEAIVTALREVEPPPAEAAYRLAKRRADAVRDAVKKADVDPARLQVNKNPEALDTFEAGRVDFAVSDRVKQRRTLADMLRALIQALTQRLQALKR